MNIYQNLRKVIINIVFFLLPLPALFGKPTELEKAFTSANFFDNFYNAENLILKVHDKLISNPNLDKELRKFEITFVKEIYPIGKTMNHQRIIKNQFLLTQLPKSEIFLEAVLRYYLARDLILFSDKEALHQCDLALSLIPQKKYKNLQTLIYSYKAGLYYQRKNFKSSEEYYRKTLTKLPSNCLLYYSMTNNLALAEKNLGKYKKSLHTFNRALEHLKKVPIEMERNYLEKLIHANIGEVYYLMGKNDLAIKYLRGYLEFVNKNFRFRENAPKKLLILYNALSNKNQNDGEKQEIKKFLFKMIANKEYLNLQLNASESLIKIFEKEKKFKEVITVLEINRKFRIETEENNVKETKSINYSLLKLTQTEQKKKYQNEKEALKKQTNLELLTLFLLLLIVIIGGWFFYKSKQQIISINQLQKLQLDQEVKLKEATINQLQLNIELKNSMNKIFVDNIKSLRKQKNVSTEEVLKEMQIQLSNLVQIDKNNSGLSKTVDAEKVKFLETLKAKHPDLTRGELELCGYLRLELNSKEIASLMNNTDGTVRVNKTKLKAKLGIPREKTIEEYLKELMC